MDNITKYTSEELKALSVQELESKLKEDASEYQKARFNHAAVKIANFNQFKEMRRNIARINTELRAREIAAKK